MKPRKFQSGYDKTKKKKEKRTEQLTQFDEN